MYLFFVIYNVNLLRFSGFNNSKAKAIYYYPLPLLFLVAKYKID